MALPEPDSDKLARIEESLKRVEARSDDFLQALNALNITLARLYDVQMAALRLGSTDKNSHLYFQAIEEAHENGRFIGAPPMLSDDPYSFDDEEATEGPVSDE